MAISRVKPAGWGYGVKLQSSEANQLDTNLTHCFDKINGDTITGETVIDGYNLTISAPGKLQAEKIDLQDTVIEGVSSLNSEFSLDGTINLIGDVTMSNSPLANELTLYSAGSINYSDSSGGVPIGMDGYRTFLPSRYYPYSGWQVEASGYITNLTHAATDYVLYDIVVPYNATIKEVHVYIKPVNSHTDLPVTRPQVKLVKTYYDYDTTVIASATDPSTSIGEFNVSHVISMTGINHTAADTKTSVYKVVLYPEAGAESIPNMLAMGCRVLLTVKQQDPFI